MPATKQQPPAHEDISPAILYFGTPTALITTLPPDATSSTVPNIGPMSSIFWLGNHCILGLAAGSKTTENIIATKELTISLPSHNEAPNVNAIARTTGSNPVPGKKLDRSYTHCGDKFTLGNFTPLPSVHVRPPAIAECPVVMEARLVQTIDLFQDTSHPGSVKSFEVKILNVRIHPEMRLQEEGKENRIDPDAWKPLIMMFSHFYALKDGRLGSSRLAEIDEEKYRMPKEDYADGGPLERLGSADGAMGGGGR